MEMKLQAGRRIMVIQERMATDKSLILSDWQFRSTFLSTRALRCSSSSAIRIREKSPTFLKIDHRAPEERTQGHGSCDRREFDLLMQNDPFCLALYFCPQDSEVFQQVLKC